MRTSQTHPIEIGEAPCAGGVIGITFCPGKTGPSVFGSPWARDLLVDVEALRAWGASVILTLIEDHEVDLLQVRGLGEAVRKSGMTWIHAPITDLGAPDVRFELRWTLIGHWLRAALLNGERVVVHCRGGRGRAGLIAARLMVELGESASEAIAKVRQAHPGAIETEVQEAHVRGVRPVATHERDDRILGCLFGGAVGDAFGYAVEFDRLSAIKAQYGDAGLTEPQLTRGVFQVSDDTQMTLFTAEALGHAAEPDLFVDECRQAYLRWYQTQTGPKPSGPQSGLLNHVALWALRAPGNTCMSALAAGGHGAVEAPANNSKGCGGVMRTAPIGLVGLGEMAAFDLGVRASALTHGHPSGYFSGGAIAAMIDALVNQVALSEAAERALALMAGQPGAQETIQALQGAMRRAQQPLENGQVIASGELGDGWVGEEALAIGVYACLVGAGFKETMRIAANHDGDSDSTASISGQLLGAGYGLKQIPWAWIEPLDVFDAVCQAATNVMAAADRRTGQGEQHA